MAAKKAKPWNFNIKITDPILCGALDDVWTKAFYEGQKHALEQAVNFARNYAECAPKHGSLPVDPHECAAQVAREIASSIDGALRHLLHDYRGARDADAGGAAP